MKPYSVTITFFKESDRKFYNQAGDLRPNYILDDSLTQEQKRCVNLRIIDQYNYEISNALAGQDANRIGLQDRINQLDRFIGECARTK